MNCVRVVCESTVLFTDVREAKRYGQRLRGLLAHTPLRNHQGLLLHKCCAIHTVGMRYPIDVVFLDVRGQVVGLRRSLVPNRLAFEADAWQVLEVAGGSIDRLGLSISMRLKLVSVNE